jgi:hypothetical protein
MTQEAPQKVSDMLRMTAENSSEFFKQVANHIEQLEDTIICLEAKLEKYQELEKKEDDDHK